MIETASFEEVAQIRMSRKLFGGEHAFAALSNGQYATENLVRSVRPLHNLKIGSRKRALEIFRGSLPPQRSAHKDDCLSALARVSSLQRSEEAQGRKMSSAQRDPIFKSLSVLKMGV